ncbi:hypothetical protein SYNPS1DRAFT_30529 [Syncephalis pseudoplumigaleata]|uniref:Uncharacterized protein n=1 Tax=Syncephalis pseudoplumigaleata TaxID=1712513 RepID=A0A4P9YUQ4_9FUNG|nr:hypothetical protein SYNPS1DRAFT_30529 [Syncephalis pseudoplumigaleata]|eukprot:RKP23716.1 hypothetical protein SYNPS1DRAFT_30529 [Syncephalis pseudoplumigaleata]
MNHLRAALNDDDDDTSTTRLPAHLAVALQGHATVYRSTTTNKEAIAVVIPEAWSMPAHIAEAKHLLLLRQQLPLDAIDTLVGAGHDEETDLYIDDVDMVDPTSDENTVPASATSTENDVADSREQFGRVVTAFYHNDEPASIDELASILRRLLAYPHRQLTMILAHNEDLFARLSDAQLARLLDVLLPLLTDTSTTLSHRICLLQHLILPKLCHSDTKPTRHLQQLLATIAQQAPHACAHGIFFLWPL